MKNFYGILEVSPDASAEQIKRAYRVQAKRFHPDKNGGDKACEERFKEIQQAYETLSNPSKKARYDAAFDVHFKDKRDESAGRGPQKGPPPSSPSRATHRASAEPFSSDAQKKSHTPNNADPKKEAELSFEDKAWIFFGNFMAVGLVGVWMFFQFLKQGYSRKARTVCWLTISSLAVMFLIAFLIGIIQLASA